MMTLLIAPLLLNPLLLNHSLLLASATFYTDQTRAANGQYPSVNRARYGLCAASNAVPMGTRLRVSAHGRVVIVTITDRGGMGKSVVDMRPESFARLAGPKWRTIGRVRGVRVQVVSRGKRL